MRSLAAILLLLLVRFASTAAAIGWTDPEESLREDASLTTLLRGRKERGPLTEGQLAKNIEYIRRYAEAAQFGHANEGTLRNELRAETNPYSLREKVLKGENIQEEVAEELRKDLEYAAE